MIPISLHGAMLKHKDKFSFINTHCIYEMPVHICENQTHVFMRDRFNRKIASFVPSCS